MAISLSSFIRFQPSIPTLIFTHKHRPVRPFGFKPASSVPAPSTILSSFPSYRSSTTLYPNSNAAATSFTNRCFHTVDTTGTESELWDYDDEKAARRRGYHSKSNKLQRDGPRGAYVTKKRDDGMYVRVDIPGVGKDALKVWVEKDSVLRFQGKTLSDEHESPRSYGGGFVCCMDTYDLNGVKVTLMNGILTMIIPKKASNPLTKVVKLLFPSPTKVATTPTSTNIADDGTADKVDESTVLENEDEPEKHPFQISGPRGAWGFKIIEEGMFLRLDMPGVGKNDFKFWMDDTDFFFKGKAMTESQYEEGRVYNGNILVGQPGWYNMKERVRTEVKNGVVKIIIPATPLRMMF